MKLFYSSDKTDAGFLVRGEDFRHIVKVLRYKSGQNINLIDGSGSIYECRICDVGKDWVRVEIMDKTEGYRLPYRLAIAISPVKNLSRFEWFLEKSVEIGITDIFPLVCNRTEKVSIKRERAIKIIQSAMKQSGSTFEPVLYQGITIAQLLKLTGWESRYLAYINEDVPDLLSLERRLKPSILVAIGPEGGFTMEEADMCTQAGFKAVSLGKTRLRTETAGIVACQIVKTLSENGHVGTIKSGE